MGDGDHFGAAGDWTRDKTERLGKSLGELIQIAVKQKDDEIEALRSEVERLTNELSGYESAYEQRCDDYDRVREALFSERNRAELRGAEYHAALARAEKAEAEAERLTTQLHTVEDILGAANGTHDGYRRGAAVASAEVARDRITYLEESHRQACEEAEKRQDRAEKAERERDEARVRYCRKVAERGWESAREVCERVWPGEADALFPAAEVVTVAGEVTP